MKSYFLLDSFKNYEGKLFHQSFLNWTNSTYKLGNSGLSLFHKRLLRTLLKVYTV